MHWVHSVPRELRSSSVRRQFWSKVSVVASSRVATYLQSRNSFRSNRPCSLPHSLSSVGQLREMKRKATESQVSSKAKRVREAEPEYCDAACQRDENDSVIWPAPSEAMESARSFLKEWYSAHRSKVAPYNDLTIPKCGLRL